MNTKTINLKKLHPHSFRYFLYLLMPWIVGLGLIIFSSSIGHAYIAQSEDLAHSAFSDGMTKFLVAGSIVVLLARIVYCLSYLKRCTYEVRSGNLIISRGIFLRNQGSFPLRRITDVYTRNNWRTLLFGLYEVEILTPSGESKEFSHIEGLSRRTALALKERVMSLIEEGDRDSSELKSKLEKAKAFLPLPSPHLPAPAHQRL